MKECIVVLLGFILMFVLIGGGMLWFDSYHCASRWADSEYKHTKYGAVAGCRVSKDGVFYMPDTSIRDF